MRPSRRQTLVVHRHVVQMLYAKNGTASGLAHVYQSISEIHTQGVGQNAYLTPIVNETRPVQITGAKTPVQELAA